MARFVQLPAWRSRRRRNRFLPSKIRVAYTVSAASGAYAITGTAVTLIAGAHYLVAAAGSYTITTTAVTLVRAFRTPVNTGFYSITGTPVTLATVFRVVATAGAYSFTGTTVDVGVGLIATAGSYVITGTPATLTYVGTVVPSITFRSLASTTYSSRTSLSSVNKPAGAVENDILLATMIWTRPDTTTEVTAPSGFTAINPSTVATGGGINVKLRVWWKRATSSEPTSYTFSHTGITMNTQIVMEAYSNCIDSGSPIDAYSVAEGSGSTSTVGSITTSVPYTTLVLAGHNFDADGSSKPVGGNWAERFDNVVTVYDRDHLSATATGTVTHTPNGTISSGRWQSWLIALKRNPNDTATVTGQAMTLSVGQAESSATTSYAHVPVTGLGMTISTNDVLFTSGPPVFRSLSDTGYVTGTIDEHVANAPSGLTANDIILATVVWSRTDLDGYMIPPAGFTEVGPLTVIFGTPIYVKQQVWWKRATSSEPATYAFTHPGTGAQAQIVLEAFSNCLVTGNPIDTYSTASGTGSTSTAASITTTFTDDLLILTGHNFDASGSSPPSGGWTERVDYVVTAYDVEQLTTGATGAISHTPNGSGGSAPWQSWLIALRGALSTAPRFEVTGQELTMSVGSVLGLTGALYGWDSGTLTGVGTLGANDVVLRAGPSSEPTTASSTMTWGAGLHYAEVTIQGEDLVGLCGLYNEEEDTGWQIELQTGDLIERPSGQRSLMFAPLVDGDVIGIAHSQTSPAKAWFRLNGGAWNEDLAQAPDSTGVGLWEPPATAGLTIPVEDLIPWPFAGRVTVSDIVYEGYDIPETLIIGAPATNVTIRNCRVYSAHNYYGISADETSDVHIDHCLVTTEQSNLNGLAGISCSLNGSVTNCEITGWSNGLFFGEGNTISNNYVHDLSFELPDAHVDGFQTAGGSNCVIDNNWIESQDTSVIMMQAVYLPINNVLIENNTLIARPGSGYGMTIYGQPHLTGEMQGLRINRNRMERGGQYYFDDGGSCVPECFDNIDYFTSELILQEYQGYAISGRVPGMTMSAGLVHVYPVEPTGTSMTMSVNYVGVASPAPVAAPYLRNYGSSAYETMGPATITKPVATQEGDLMIVAMIRGTSLSGLDTDHIRDPIPPAGWAQLDETRTTEISLGWEIQFTIWYKRAGASEPDTYDFGFWEYTRTQWFIGSYVNVLAGLGAFDSMSYNAGTAVDITGLSVFCTQPDDMLLYLGWNNTNTPLSPPMDPPVGMTELVDDVPHSAGEEDIPLYIAEQSITAAGYTGDRVHTQPVPNSWEVIMVALRGA